MRTIKPHTSDEIEPFKSIFDLGNEVQYFDITAILGINYSNFSAQSGIMSIIFLLLLDIKKLCLCGFTFSNMYNKDTLIMKYDKLSNFLEDQNMNLTNVDNGIFEDQNMNLTNVDNGIFEDQNMNLTNVDNGIFENININDYSQYSDYCSYGGHGISHNVDKFVIKSLMRDRNIDLVLYKDVAFSLFRIDKSLFIKNKNHNKTNLQIDGEDDNIINSLNLYIKSLITRANHRLDRRLTCGLSKEELLLTNTKKILISFAFVMLFKKYKTFLL